MSDSIIQSERACYATGAEHGLDMVQWQRRLIRASVGITLSKCVKSRHLP